METHPKRINRWIPLAFLLIHSVAILIFTRGFLLTRTELPFHSTCSDASLSPCLSPNPPIHHSYSNQNQPKCWTKPVVDRVVIIVLDALRIDFLAPSAFFPAKPWMDKLTVLQNLAFGNESSAKIFKAFADPPTTSLQRLKGLTTGGLPTFVDVGNSFGAPAIVEDNFINQLVLNGKRLVMMGDDTWTQLFPNQFHKSYPFPSFNVKDLDTVDNGCIEHLFPTLYKDDWDVLIAHFLGVDHAGHIFGVDSMPMINKLEQYNTVLERVVDILESQAGPGGVHENTMLIVMGDHGQTLNGDHGGGTAEEVETTMFAMSTKKHTTSVPPEFDTSSCKQDPDGKQMCISSIEQLDFAATLSALLGISFPFGSIGHVNPELYALGSSSLNLDNTKQPAVKEWMKSYVNVLCVNAWQVKRYIDVYSNSSVVGFSSDDMSRISNLYSAAEHNWSNSVKHILMYNDGNEDSTNTSALKAQIAAYLKFFSSVAELARSKWTEFNLSLMITGFGILVISLILQSLAIVHGDNKPYGVSSGLSTGAAFTLFIVLIRACSFLSNSYILEEGKVANFLLATTGLIKLRYSVMRKTMRKEAFVFLAMVSVLRVSIDIGLTKQAATSQFMSSSPTWMLGLAPDHPALTYAIEIAPILSVAALICVLYVAIARTHSEGIWKYVTVGSMLSYFLIALLWASESKIFGFDGLLQVIGGRNIIPQTVYVIGLVQLFLLASAHMFCSGKDKNWGSRTVALVSACSSPVILLSGKQGSMLALAYLLAGYCIMRLEGVERRTKSDGQNKFSKLDSVCVVQWSLLSVCMFFASGHWCAFDGLRYGAAFVGFDEFVLIRQAILLTIETFGFSIILSVFGLPLLIPSHGEKRHQLFQMYMLYGVISATTVTATILCVTIHRRHLMVWGLFAPKFVFDVVGLILTDVLICLASAFYL
ncbi:PREDICTED: GPI ethanolamine phosphate transferase 3 isoform X2 [Brassica oleracea var. oleracea]|uniref:GPI ethanolamine phosphate transferase 3 isoform X2 n=1 Tax=Brassica oleracea var. oleracea TaxID=109376 RepID=UPI0006A6CBBA|nr:PREDICTED: GPI ethanolamine phosphate transferase 3 isoform X2 [Brassica oleracea var. oleracea]